MNGFSPTFHIHIHTYIKRHVYVQRHAHESGGSQTQFHFVPPPLGCRTCPRNALNLESICQRYLSTDCKPATRARVSWFACVSREGITAKTKSRPSLDPRRGMIKSFNAPKRVPRLGRDWKARCLKLIDVFGRHKLFSKIRCFHDTLRVIVGCRIRAYCFPKIYLTCYLLINESGTMV